MPLSNSMIIIFQSMDLQPYPYRSITACRDAELWLIDRIHGKPLPPISVDSQTLLRNAVRRTQIMWDNIYMPYYKSLIASGTIPAPDGQAEGSPYIARTLVFNMVSDSSMMNLANINALREVEVDMNVLYATMSTIKETLTQILNDVDSLV